MKAFINEIWNGEPVRLAGYVAAGWTAVASVDAASPTFNMPAWLYAVAAVVMAVATRYVRGKVTPVTSTQ